MYNNIAYVDFVKLINQWTRWRWRRWWRWRNSSSLRGLARFICDYTSDYYVAWL